MAGVALNLRVDKQVLRAPAMEFRTDGLGRPWSGETVVIARAILPLWVGQAVSMAEEEVAEELARVWYAGEVAVGAATSEAGEVSQGATLIALAAAGEADLAISLEPIR